MGELVLVGVGVLFAGMGGLMLYAARAMARQVENAAGWPTTTGRVLSSEVVVQRSQEGSTWVPVVDYEYEVEGRRYQSNGIAIGGATGMLKSYAERTVARYPKESDVTVHYAPTNPENACLELRSTNAPFLMVLGSAGLLAGAALVGFGLHEAGWL